MSYYLGFDCATKTLAFGLVWVDLEGFRRRAAALRAELAAAKGAGGAAGALRLKKIGAEIDGFVRILRGDVVDLFPGRADASIHSVERIQALAKYVNEVVKPKTPSAAPLTVMIEFQMGANARSRMIAAALVALFPDFNVCFVGPSLKNKVYFTEDGRYCHFVEKNKTTYAANKAHAKYNFKYLEKTLGTSIPKTKISRGHLADAIMQIFGHLKYGSTQPAF